jgi:RNA-directed DNA polymerase
MSVSCERPGSVFRWRLFQWTMMLGLVRSSRRHGLLNHLIPQEADMFAFVLVPRLERRATLGLVSRGESPAPEARTRHRIPRVAWPQVPTVMQRTPGGEGPPCARVKALSPVVHRDVGADLRSHRAGHLQGANGQGAREPTGVEDRGTSTGHGRARGRSAAFRSSRGRAGQPAPREDARQGRGSRLPPDERGRGGTPAEPRGAQAVAGAMAPPSTRRGGATATTGVASIASRARREPGATLTALLHPVTVDNLRACVEARDGRNAPGRDGVTNAQDGQAREANLQVLCQQRGPRSYRPQPGRRVELPTADGTMRPVGMSCIADPIVQERTRRLLEAIDDPSFREPADGFRPGRSGHDARRRLNREGMRAPVTGIAALDLAPFCDTMPPTAILAGLAERLKEQPVVRVMARRLKAGVQTPGGVGQAALGSPPGAIGSPARAHGFLDTGRDPWCATVVQDPCRGDGELLREAEDPRAVCEAAREAQRFLRVLPRRLAQCGLRRNAHKPRRLACGRRQARRPVRAGPHPPTFDFLGRTHDGGLSRQGKVRLKRTTSKTRLRRALVAINQWLRQARNEPKLPGLWQALGRKLRGPFHDVGVTDNRRALYRFEQAVRQRLFKWLKRRRQRRRCSWASVRRYEARHPLPRPGLLGQLTPVWGRTA